MIIYLLQVGYTRTDSKLESNKKVGRLGLQVNLRSREV